MVPEPVSKGFAMKRLSRFAVAALVGFSSGSVIALVSYELGTWLGGHADNLRNTLYFTAPLAVVLGIVAALQPADLHVGKRGVVATISTGAVVGLLYGFLAFRFIILGFLAVTVQALSCWVASGLSAMLAVAVEKFSRKTVAIVGVCLLAIFLPKPVFNTFTRNQQLTVAFVIRSSGSEETPSPKALFFDNAGAVEVVSKQVLEHIRTLGITGNFRVVHLSRQGEGRQSLAILITGGPIEERTLLPEPDGTTVIYVQESGGWTKHPADAPTLKRSIEVSPPTKDGAIGYLWVPMSSGLRYGDGIRVDRHSPECASASAEAQRLPNLAGRSVNRLPGESFRHSPVIAFEIKEDGSISNLRLVRSSGIKDLDKKTMAAVAVWKYKPRPGCGLIESEMTVTVEF